MRGDLLIALRHLLVVEGRQLDGLASGKQVLSAPGALQALPDVAGATPISQALAPLAVFRET
jgi:hypothetical protein